MSDNITVKIKTTPDGEFVGVPRKRLRKFNFYALLSAIREKEYLLNRKRTDEYLEVKVDLGVHKLKNLEIRMYTKGLYSSEVWSKQRVWDKVSQVTLKEAEQEMLQYQKEGIECKVKVGYASELEKMAARNSQHVFD